MIKIVCVGKIKEKYLKDAIAEYQKRISKYTKLNIIEVKDYDYDDINKLSIYDSNKKVVLTYASYIGSVLILISGIIFLIIAITDDNIDTEIAFN